MLAIFSSFFLTAIIMFQVWCWSWAGLLVENDAINPITDIVYNAKDILIVYYALMFGMFTIP